jgi:hypothetical protein
LREHKNLVILLGSSLAVIGVLLALFSQIKLRPLWSPRERELMGFSFERIDIMRRNSMDATGLKNPVHTGPASLKGYPETTLSDMAPQEEGRQDTGVSLILIKDGRRIALVNNQFVGEGDMTSGGRVMSIESDRILIRRGASSTWLTLEAPTPNVLPRMGGSGSQSVMGGSRPSGDRAPLTGTGVVQNNTQGTGGRAE